MVFLSLGATLRAGPQQLLAEIGLQCGFTTGENFFEILNTLIVNQQRNRRARLPHVWHLLRPRARSFLSLLLEQLPYCKFPWSLNIAHHLNSITNNWMLQHLCLKIQIVSTFSLRCKFSSYQDVDFVSPPAPTSAFGDGQRGFRLEYRQIPCSTWSLSDLLHIHMRQNTGHQ